MVPLGKVVVVKRREVPPDQAVTLRFPAICPEELEADATMRERIRMQEDLDYIEQALVGFA
jgi:hypothetical protein